MKKCKVTIKTTFAVILSILCLNLSSARADDSDIFGANIEPNVMLLIDTSSSMDSKITSSIYAPKTDYSGAYTLTVVYKQSAGGYNLYKNTVEEVLNTNAEAALGAVGYWVGQIGGSTVSLFLGNYLNYQNCGASCDVQEKKIEIAKRVFANIVKYVEGVRFGVMRLRKNPNPPGRRGEMLATIGTDKTTMVNAIEAIVYESGTGIGEQLYDAGQYYKGGTLIDGTSYSSPIQYECQPNFIILMSDGRQNGDLTIQDEATLRYTQDHSSLTGTQNVIVHTIGFDTDSSGNDDLQEAADNGGGTFVFAGNAAQLEAALQNAIRQIVEGVFTFATPVVPTTSVTGSSRAYIAAVQSDPSSPSWRGYLKAYNRETDGSIKLLTDGSGLPDPTNLAWEAGAVLAATPAANRNIYFQSFPNAFEPDLPRVRENFLTSKVAPGVLDLPSGMTTAEKNEARDRIVNFIRGVDVLDEDGDTFTNDERPWKLGDIFHSTPALVSPPFLPLNDTSYDAFKAAQASRPSVLIVGANDGMLHAFRESDGVELWAWVPEHVFYNLQSLLTPGGNHPYFVDASPVAADIKIDGTWKTIVMFGLRRGGAHYYALDITDTTDPTLLWEFNDTNLGETWSEPAIGKIKWEDGSDRYVAFFGGGYDTFQNNRTGKAFFMIDLATGQKLADYYDDGNSSDTKDDKYMNFSLAANPTAVDLDFDGYIDRVYIGDVGGQLWKFEPTFTPGTPSPTTYLYRYYYSSVLYEKEFTMMLKSSSITEVDLYLASTITNPLMPISPTSCSPDCYVYENDGRDPEDENHDDHFGFVSLDPIIHSGNSPVPITGVTFVEDINSVATTGTFELKGKRLFEADTAQSEPPADGEYYPAQGIYGAPSVARDNNGDEWVYFGTGDKNHPLNTGSNRFYGIRDNEDMQNSKQLDEGDLQLVNDASDVVSTSEEGWYFILESGEKVLASAETFNHTVFFTTFKPDSASADVCSTGGGEARLYAIKMDSGFAAVDFTSTDNVAQTANYADTSRWTKIGDGIPSKPAVMVDPNGNPSVVTGTTSQQISNEAAPKPALPQLLGWREVF